MKVLVTGAFGGVGTEVLRVGSKMAHGMSAFELDTPANRKKASRYGVLLDELYWGDLRNTDDVMKAVTGKDAVIHLGAIITPLSEQHPELSHAVNVDGTKNIIQAIRRSEGPPGLVFTSSMSIMGADANRQPPLRVSDPVSASSNYTAQKIECEQLLRESGLPWTILRLGAVINTDLSAGGGSIGQLLDEIFAMSLNNRIEGVWNIDVAAALIAAAECLKTGDDVTGKTFFIGGGRRLGWQLTVRELYRGVFGAIGFGLPKDSCFNTQPYYADWLDTEESQRLFQYQNHSFEEFLTAVREKIGITRIFIRFFAPLLRLIMCLKSGYR